MAEDETEDQDELGPVKVALAAEMQEPKTLTVTGRSRAIVSCERGTVQAGVLGFLDVSFYEDGPWALCSDVKVPNTIGRDANMIVELNARAFDFPHVRFRANPGGVSRDGAADIHFG